MKIAACNALGFFDKLWYGIYANYMDIPCGEFTSKPPFTATDVEHRAWRTAQNRVDDRRIGNLPATLDLSVAHRDDPQRSILAP